MYTAPAGKIIDTAEFYAEDTKASVKFQLVSVGVQAEDVDIDLGVTITAIDYDDPPQQTVVNVTVDYDLAGGNVWPLPYSVDWSTATTIEEFVAEASTGLQALLAPPFMHGAGHWMSFRTWLGGGTVFVQSVPERLDPVDIWSMVERERINFLLIVGDVEVEPTLALAHSLARYSEAVFANTEAVAYYRQAMAMDPDHAGDLRGKVFMAMVHRLDRPVAGVVLFARTSKAADRLTRQFRENQVTKIYWAMIPAEMAPASGAPLSRSSILRMTPITCMVRPACSYRHHE